MSIDVVYAGQVEIEATSKVFLDLSIQDILKKSESYFNLGTGRQTYNLRFTDDYDKGHYDVLIFENEEFSFPVQSRRSRPKR